MNSPDSLRSPVKNARGLGSARSGVHHFIVQRATAVALLFLTVYLVVLLVSLIGADYSQARAAVGLIIILGLLIFLVLLSWAQKRDFDDAVQWQKEQTQKAMGMLADCMNGKALYDKKSNKAYFCEKAIEVPLNR